METFGRETAALLREFREQGSETAFQELVNRYINLVYSVASRRVGGDTHLAEDVVQMVFADLVRKARSLPADVMLGGWLHRHTCFVASTLMRSNRRRTEREQQAVTMSLLTETPDAEWKEIAPVLDDAINELHEPDRTAIIMRFFEHQDLRAIGEALGTSDDAAQKRVSRALEKLRELLVKRGIGIAVPALAGLLTANSISAAPSTWAALVSKAALRNAETSLTPWLVKPALVGLLAVAIISAIMFRPNSPIQSSAQSPAVTETVSAPTDERLAEVATDLAPPLATELLRLLFVAADSGKPIPNPELRVAAAGFDDVERVVTGNRDGTCKVPLAREKVTSLVIKVRADGFADTRLHWYPRNGDQIPETYTCRMVRAVRIGGRVIDADGRPVAGATVGWGHTEDPSFRKFPEDHEFLWMQTTTDHEGRWQLHRIAPEALDRIEGSARHPEHGPTRVFEFARDREGAAALLKGAHIFQFERGILVTGSVLGPGGQPISGASVSVGEVGNADRREGVTAADGTFSIAGCASSAPSITALAKGFAATTRRVDLSTEHGPFELRLQPGRVVRLRVMDQNHNPIPGARVWYDTLESGASQEEFSSNTGNDGTVIWQTAPLAEIKFDVSARGFMESRRTPLAPHESEKTIVLSPATEISGTVRDESGQPIPRFRIITGSPTFDGSNESGVRWSTFSRFWFSFAAGKFNLNMREPVVRPHRGFVFKFDAEGYAPYVSRVITPEEAKVNLDVIMRPTAAITISVILPDGHPAQDADIGFVSPDSGIQIGPGGLPRSYQRDLTAIARTDARGQFRFPLDPPRDRIVFAHPRGYAEVSPALATNYPIIRLEPWGAIKGIYTVNGQRVAGRRLSLNLADGSSSTVQCVHKYFSMTDSQGRFSFDTIPPTRLKIVEHVPDNPEKPKIFTMVDLQEFAVQPGETLTVNVGQ